MSAATLEERIARVLGYRPTDREGQHSGTCGDCGDAGAWINENGHVCEGCGARSLDEMVRHLGLWPEPDVPGSGAPEALPLHALPAVLRDHALSVARSAQVSPDMTVLLGIAAISATAAGKVVVRVDDAWTREWVTFYGVIVAPPGERKSAAYREAMEPLRVWEREEIERVAPLRRMAEEKADVAERKLRRTKDAAAKGGAEMDEVEADMLALDAARKAIPALPELLAQDATPEALVQQMAEQGGRAAVMSPEGGPLRILDGRYSDGAARLEELAQAYDGEELRPRRIGRETRVVRRPALTMAVALQPSVLHTVRNGRSFRGQGIYGRIAWVVPTTRVGERVDSSEAPTLDEEAASGYAKMLRQLLDWSPEKDSDGSPVPVELTLSPAAAEVKRTYHYRVERALCAGGEYASIADAATKAVGRAIRIAALLELAARAADGRKLTGEPIAGWAMESGVQLCEALMTHTLRVYGEMEMDTRTADLRYLLDRLPWSSESSSWARAELFWRLREALERREVRFPKNDQLMAKLSAFQFGYSTWGQILLERKEQTSTCGTLYRSRGRSRARIPWSNHSAALCAPSFQQARLTRCGGASFREASQYPSSGRPFR